MIDAKSKTSDEALLTLQMRAVSNVASHTAETFKAVTYAFYYEIDCERVGNSIDVIDLVSVTPARFHTILSNFILFILSAKVDLFS